MTTTYTVTVYRGTVQNVTANLLRYWVRRAWLDALFFGENAKVDLSTLPQLREEVNNRFPANTGYCYKAEDWSGIAEFASDDYTFTLTLRTVYFEADEEPQRASVDKYWHMFLWAAQERANEVGVMIHVPKHAPKAVVRLVDSLRVWLKVRYGCIVTGSDMPQEDSEMLKNVMDFIELREKPDNRKKPVKALVELDPTKFGSYSTLNRNRNYLNQTYNLNLEW